MPTNVTVKVNTIQPITRGAFNLIEITGYDHTNNKGFKKSFFEEKKGGGRTKAAELADTLVKDDWVEFVLDDTSYANVQTLKKTAEPAGGDSVPSQGGGGGGQRPGVFGAGAPSDKMSKAEWAEKDRKKDVAMARSVAVKAAVAMTYSTGKMTAGIVKALEKLTLRIEAYLLKGDFDACLADDPKEPGDDREEDTPKPSTSGEDQTGQGPDDDIPF